MIAFRFITLLVLGLISIEQSEAKTKDQQIQEKLAMIDHFDTPNISPKYKIGMDALRKMVTEVYVHIMPDLDEDDPNYSDTLFDNYKNKKIPILTEYVNRDLTRFRGGIWKAYEKSPEIRDRIQKRLVEISEKYSNKQLTLLEYLEFTAELTMGTNEVQQHDKNSLPDKIKYIRNFPSSPDNVFGFMVPVPLHTGQFNFDGMFGEATITAAMLIGLMPIMYVTKPDVMADNIFCGPDACYKHDIHAHYFLYLEFSLRSYFVRHDLPRIIKEITLNDWYTKKLFNIIHEENIDYWNITNQDDLEKLAPIYLSYLNLDFKYLSKKLNRPLSKEIDFSDIRELSKTPDLLKILKVKPKYLTLDKIALALILDISSTPENLNVLKQVLKGYDEIANNIKLHPNMDIPSIFGPINWELANKIKNWYLGIEPKELKALIYENQEQRTPPNLPQF